MTDTPLENIAPIFRAGTSDAEIEAAALKAIRRRKHAVLFWRLVILVGILGAWELAANRLWIDPFFYSSPSGIVMRLYEWITEGTAEDALVDVDALDLVEAHLEGAALDEAGLVDDPHIGDVGLGGPAMEPGGKRPVERKQGRESGHRQAEQHRHVGDDHPRQGQEYARHDPGRHCRQVEHPVRIGGIQHLLAGLQDFVDITPHTPVLN